MKEKEMLITKELLKKTSSTSQPPVFLDGEQIAAGQRGLVRQEKKPETATGSCA